MAEEKTSTGEVELPTMHNTVQFEPISPKETSDEFETPRHPDVDVGFPVKSTTIPLDKGKVVYLKGLGLSGQYNEDDIVADQEGLSTAGQCATMTACACISLTILGLPYIFSKTKVVPHGHIALCRDFQERVRIIRSGCHLKETLFKTVKIFDLKADVIHFGPVWIINILPGYIGLGTLDNDPVMLLAGRHVINDTLFKFKISVDVNKPHIKNGPTHIIVVQEGQNGRGSVNGVGHIFEPGVHEINNGSFEWKGFVDAQKEHFAVCCKHRLLIPEGKVGLAWDNGKPILLDSGKLYNIDSQYFRFSKSVALTSEIITHGSLDIVIVKDGKLGISYDDGELKVLKPDRHFLPKATHSFQGFLSSGQQTLPIDEVTSMSSDNVGLRFDAAITFQVVDGRKAVTSLGGTTFTNKDFYSNVIKKAKLALTIIIGNNKITQSFSATSVARSRADGEDCEDNKNDDTDDQGESFKKQIHDGFMGVFKVDMLRDCGVNVIDMSINDIEITNADLASAMARGAVKATELEMALMDRMIQNTEANTATQAKIIRAEGEKRAVVIKAEGEARALDILAQAQAEKIHKLDAAIGAVCATSKSRVLMEASGSALQMANSTVVLANDMIHLRSILGHDADMGVRAAASAKKNPMGDIPSIP